LLLKNTVATSSNLRPSTTSKDFKNIYHHGILEKTKVASSSFRGGPGCTNEPHPHTPTLEPLRINAPSSPTAFITAAAADAHRFPQVPTGSHHSAMFGCHAPLPRCLQSLFAKEPLQMRELPLLSHSYVSSARSPEATGRQAARAELQPTII
jgi:hypothetical protein